MPKQLAIQWKSSALRWGRYSHDTKDGSLYRHDQVSPSKVYIWLGSVVAFLRNSQMSDCRCSYSLPATPAFSFQRAMRAPMPPPYVVYSETDAVQVYQEETLFRFGSHVSCKREVCLYSCYQYNVDPTTRCVTSCLGMRCRNVRRKV